MKLELVGEQPYYNEYEVSCALAQDVDLSRGTLRPRLDDTTLASGDIKRVVCADGGIVRHSTTPGYVFSWGDATYWLNNSNNWQRVDGTGNVTNLSVPGAPSISSLDKPVGYWSIAHGTNGSWNVAPSNQTTSHDEWTGLSAGSVSRTFTWNAGQQVTWGRRISISIYIPADAVNSVRVSVNGNERYSVIKQEFGNYYIVQAELQGVSTLNSITISYRTETGNHTLRIGNQPRAFGDLPMGQHAYIATVERNGVESLPSNVGGFYFGLDVLSPADVGQVRATVSGCTSGDTVRLYRAVDGIYYEVASGTATGSSIMLTDAGDVGEPYRPSGILPFGPALVLGNRVAIASGRIVYLSQPGSPTRFGSIAMNEDNLDAFSVVLPGSVVALSHHELGVVAHTRSHRYLIRLQPQFDGDLLHRVPPMRIDAPTARSHRAVWGQLLVDTAGDVWLNDQRLFGGLSGDVHALEVDGRLYIGVGSRVFVSKPAWQGWVEYSVSGTVQWMTTDGVDVFVATSSGLYKLEGSSTRKSICVWRTGKLFGDRISALRYVHLAGTASQLKLIRPGKPDVVLNNVSGRVHVPAGEQTHEWQLEMQVSSELYMIHLTAEGGIN